MSDRSLVRASVAISMATLAAIAYLIAHQLTESNATRAPRAPTAIAQDPSPRSREAQPVEAMPPALAIPSPSRARPAQAARSQVGKARSGAGEDRFWTLIEETRRAAANDTARQSELLEERLARLWPEAIIEFATLRRRLDRQAYSWNLWGAATVIEDGCSDDCFRDFRAYVISLGRAPYERALRNPDSLASSVEDAETGDWENADNVAPDAYADVTGANLPLDDSDLSGRPAGTRLELDGSALARRYPRLAARFRGR